MASSHPLAAGGGLIERLIAGPDDAELSPRELVLLEAYLKHMATGHSPTASARNKLKLIRDYNRGLQEQGDADGPKKPARGGSAESPEPAPKRSTERGEAQAKLIAALTRHHQHADGCLNLEPIDSNELAKAAAVSPSAASAFFNDKFKGHTKYRTICQDAGKLWAALKLLNGKLAPYHLLGDVDRNIAAPEKPPTRDPVIIDRCPRCMTPHPGASLCDSCARRLCVGDDRRRSMRHRPVGDEPNPWQEIAIRYMEDHSDIDIFSI